MRSCRHCWVFVFALISTSVFAQSIPATFAHKISAYTPTSEGWSIACRNAANAAVATIVGRVVTSESALFAALPANICDDGYLETVSLSSSVNGGGNAIYRSSGSGVWRAQVNFSSTGSYTCPAGYTLNGNMCDPELQCPPGQSKWNGQCKPDCLFLQRRDQTTGECNCNREGNTSIGINEYVDTSGEGPLPDKVCVHGCEFNIGEGIGMGAQFWAGQRTTATGAVCDPSKALVDKPQPPKKKPPCAANEGVMTSSSGTVACVPEGTPGAKKPEVEVKKKKETFPDGSVKETTETKTKDTNTGATNTSTTTTSTGGLSGSSGTSTSEEDKEPTKGGDGDGECEGDDCDEGDGPEFEGPEGDGLYEKGDRTIRDALNDFVAGITGAPIYNTASTWFNVMAMPSGCGGMSTNVPLLNITISLDEYLCGPSAQTIVQIAGVVVLALAAFAAFRIGFL